MQIKTLYNVRLCGYNKEELDTFFLLGVNIQLSPYNDHLNIYINDKMNSINNILK